MYRNLAKRVQKGNHPTIKKAILYFGDLDKRATMYESFGEIPPSRMKRKYAVCAKNEGNDRKVKGKNRERVGGWRRRQIGVGLLNRDKNTSSVTTRPVH